MATKVQNNLGWSVGSVVKKVYKKRMKKINWFKDYQSPECSGWILDTEELADAQRKGANKVELVDTTSDDTSYEITIEKCRKNGILHDGRNGEFYVIPLQEFQSSYKNFPRAI